MSVRFHDPREARRAVALFALFVVGIVLLVALFYLRARTQFAADQVARLEREVDAARQAQTLLEAEAAHLSNPARLAELGGRELGLRPAAPDQIQAEAAILAIPLRTPVQEAASE